MAAVQARCPIPRIYPSTGAHGYTAYPLNYRHLEEAMEERGAEVGHSSINRRAFGNTSIAQSTMQFFDKAMRANGIPEKVAMDKSGAKKSATDQILEGKDIEVDARQIKYISNIVEQDRRAIKRNTRPMLGFKKFRATENVPAGIEFMPMVRK